MSSNWSDPNWWPAPRRPPKPPPSASKIVLGTLLPIAAIAGLVIALTGFRHSDNATHGRTKAPAAVTTGPVDARQAFEDCMRSAVGSRPSGFGRFGGPSRDQIQKEQAAFAVCRTILQGGAPSAPTTTAPTAPPVA